MRRLIVLLLTFVTLVSASSVDSKISSNKKELSKQNSAKSKTTAKIKQLAKQINSQTKELQKLEQEIILINQDIDEHKKLLNRSQGKLRDYQTSSKKIIKEKQASEEQIVNVLIEDFSSSIAIKLANEDSLEELIDSEVYMLLSKNAKESMVKLNSEYNKLSQNKKANEESINKLQTYINKREKKKDILNALINKHSKALKSLEGKHVAYQKELKALIKKQKSIQDLLAKLNIVKKKEDQIAAKKREQKRLAALKKKKAQTPKKSTTSSSVAKNQAEKIDLDVRMLGSSTKGVKISKYYGSKTIAPLKSYKVVKRFGKYYDPVYKIQLFHESVVLKANKPRSKVYSILNGKIVYAKKNAGILDNVVIVQHRNGLHTIYSHLDQISPTLKVGKWIKKGYVVGRVNDTLTFQATKNNTHINPQDLFR